MSELHDLTLAQLAAQLRQRKASAVEAAQHFLERAKQHDALGAARTELTDGLQCDQTANNTG